MIYHSAPWNPHDKQHDDDDDDDDDDDEEHNDDEHDDDVHDDDNQHDDEQATMVKAGCKLSWRWRQVRASAQPLSSR